MKITKFTFFLNDWEGGYAVWKGLYFNEEKETIIITDSESNNIFDLLLKYGALNNSYNELVSYRIEECLGLMDEDNVSVENGIGFYVEMEDGPLKTPRPN